MVETWAKDYVKYDGHNVEPIHIFLSGSGGTVKSHLVKVICNAISKTLLYHCKDPEKPRVLLLGPTEISVVNIDRTTINPGLGIRPGIKLLGLNNKSKTALRNRWTFYGIKWFMDRYWFKVGRNMYDDSCKSIC